MKKLFLLLYALALTGLPMQSVAQISAGRVKGFTEPFRSIDVAAAEAGILAGVQVVEGDRVGSGDVLAFLSQDVLKASLAMAVEGENAPGKLNSVEAERDMQRERLEKIRGLFQRRHASQVEIDRAVSQLEVAEAQVQAVRDELRIKSLEIRRIEAQLEQRRMRSPIDGIVTRVFKEPGEFVSANDPVVATVVQLDPLLVVFSVPDSQALTMSVGQSVPLLIGIDEEVMATVDFISPTIEAQSGTRRVKILIENSDLRLPSGQTCYLFAEDSIPRVQSASHRTVTDTEP